MDPVDVAFDEFIEVEGCGCGAGFAFAGAADVGDVAVHVFAVGFPEGQGPDRVTDVGGGGELFDFVA